MDYTVETTLSEAGMLLEDEKATKQMKQSISRFATLLICPLCHKILDRPATLSACGHTFCMNCIDSYSSNNCECPAEGCGMPLSIVGSNGGSFRKLNIQISQTIESLQLICKSLNQMEENWWISPITLQSLKVIKCSKTKDRQEVLSEVLGSSDRKNFPLNMRLVIDAEIRNNTEDEGMVDLQLNSSS